METKDLHNKDLFELIAQGDERAFRQVHEMYKGRLLYYANRLTGDWNEAEDIVADVFVALWNHREQMKSDKHIENLLFLAVRNKAIDFTGLRGRRMQLLNEISFPLALEEDIYDLKMMEEQMLHLLHQAAITLPTECARIFELSWRYEQSPAEIGRILDMNPATVRSQKRRAIQLIRAWIKKNAPIALLFWGSFFTSYIFSSTFPDFFARCAYSFVSIIRI